MSLELEDRLRAMYTAVAATTDVDTTELEFAEPELVSVRTPPAPITMRRVRIVALVAAAAAVLAGLVLVVSQHHDRKPTASLKERPFVVPTHVPEGYALTQWEVAPAEVMPGFVRGGTEVAHLTYVGPDHARLEVFSAFDNGDVPSPGTKGVDIAHGVGRLTARLNRPLTGTGQTVAWVQPGGNRASIRADALTDDQLIDIAAGMWWVTGAMFDALTDKEGFADASTVDPWTPPGDDRSVSLVPRGSLQTGIAWGAPRGMTSFSSWFPDACSRMSTFRVPNDLTVLLRSSEPIEEFVVATHAGTTTVEAGIYPGLPNWRFATARVTDKDLQGDVPLNCTGDQP